MLTHPHSRRQGDWPTEGHHPTGSVIGPRATPRVLMPKNPGLPPEKPDTDLDKPTALDLPPHIHAAGYGGGDVDSRRICHLPSELVLAPVVVVEEGGLRFWYAPGEIVPCAPVLAGPPVIIPYIPGSCIFHGSPRARSFSHVGDPDPALAAKPYLLVREGHPVPAIVTVEAGPHPARKAPGRRLVRGLAGSRVLRGLRLPLLVHPWPQIVCLPFGQKALHARFGCRDCLLYLLIEVGSGDLVSYPGLGSSLVGLDDLIALVVLPGERVVLFANDGEALLHLVVAKAELLLEFFNVLIVREQKGEHWLLRVGVRGVALRPGPLQTER